MHPDQGTANVDTGVGADLLHSNGVFALLPAGGGPAAARMGPGHDTYFLPTVLFGGFPLNDNGPVQVLAALCRQPDAALSQHRRNACIHGLRCLQTAVFADVPAHDLAGRAAHHEHVALFQLCLFQQLFHCLPGFRLDLLFECVCHINYLVSIGCRDDPMFCIRLGPSVYNNFSGMPRAPLAGELARKA